jgi:hypothetical protein
MTAKQNTCIASELPVPQPHRCAQRKAVFCTATTGVSAVAIGGQTIHSFAGERYLFRSFICMVAHLGEATSEAI